MKSILTLEGSIVIAVAVVAVILVTILSFPSFFDQNGDGKIDISDPLKCLDVNNDGTLSLSEYLGGGGLCLWWFVLLIWIIYEICSIVAIIYVGEDFVSAVDDIDTTSISPRKKLFLLEAWKLNNMSKIATAWVYHGYFVLVLIVLFVGSIFVGGYMCQAESMDIDHDGDVDINDLLKACALLCCAFLIAAWSLTKIAQKNCKNNRTSIEEWW